MFLDFKIKKNMDKGNSYKSEKAEKINHCLILKGANKNENNHSIKWKLFGVFCSLVLNNFIQ